jgi:hypothetical protein
MKQLNHDITKNSGLWLLGPLFKRQVAEAYIEAIPKNL